LADRFRGGADDGDCGFTHLEPIRRVHAQRARFDMNIHHIRIAVAITVWSGLSLLATDRSVAQTKEGAGRRSLTDPLTEEEKKTPLDEYVSPEDIVRAAFDAPPGAKRLSKRNVWIDRDKQRVYLDGYVAMVDGPLEMFACPVGTKEHESIVGSLARSSEVHAALLAIGAQSGTPVEYLPRFVPATGQRDRVWVTYRVDKGQYQDTDARRCVRKTGTKEQMESDWVFAGSGFWKDPSNGREYYRADGGDMICVSNFNTAMMDVTINSSAEADDLQFSPYSERIPQRGTPVRLVLVPIPIPTDKPDATPKVDPDKPPGEEVLPARPQPPKTP
jgi:hypothetical protein